MLTVQQLMENGNRHTFGRMGAEPKKGVLTTEEAKEHLKRFGRITTYSVVGGEYANCWFYSDDHIFGYPLFDKSIVPGTTSLPMTVTPREGCEDGIVDNTEKYEFIFHRSGKQITTIEEVVDLCNSISGANIQQFKEKRKAAKQLKRFNPAFFPQGTVVQVNDDNNDNLRTYTVHQVVQIGPNDFCLEMEEIAIVANQLKRITYNLSYVHSVVKRGSGPLVVENSTNSGFEELRAIEENHNLKRTSYKGHLYAIGMHLMAKHGVRFDQCVHTDLLVNGLLKLSKQSVMLSTYDYIYSVNRKKANRWFKQNFNRLLCDPNVCQSQMHQLLADLNTDYD